MATQPLSAEALLSTTKVIDADTHFTEPHDLWLKRAPQSIRDRVPQVKKWGDDVAWVIDGDKVIGDKALSSSSVKTDGVKAQGIAQMKMPIDQVHPASYSAKHRLEMMDSLGVWAQIMYPNLLGFGGQKSVIVDPELRLQCVKIYNDAMAELQEEGKQRLFPMALLPWWDVKESVKEIERTKAMGLRGININSDPQRSKGADGKNLPDLNEDHWSPLWEACDSLNMPINFHIGASEGTIDWAGSAAWPSMIPSNRSCIGGVMLFLDNGRTIANVIMSGILDRYPRLKFVSVESGISWVPFLLEALDYHFAEFAQEVTLQRRPSEYWKTNFFGCFWFEQRGIVEAIERLGVQTCLFETDFPHPTCLYPTSMPEVAGVLEALGDVGRRKVLSENSAKLYNIPIG